VVHCNNTPVAFHYCDLLANGSIALDRISNKMKSLVHRASSSDLTRDSLQCIEFSLWQLQLRALSFTGGATQQIIYSTPLYSASCPQGGGARGGGLCLLWSGTGALLPR
jgi:hypothetical protein